MSKNIIDDTVVKKSKAVFESSLNDVDQDTLARLASARRTALEAVPDTTGSPQWFCWGWAGGVVATCLLVAIIGFYPRNQALDNTIVPSDFLMAEIIEADDLELLEYDAEFFEWLEDEGVI